MNDFENEFVLDLCLFIEANVPNFTFKSNLWIDETPKNTDAVYAMQTGGPEPDRYTPVQQYVIEFTARYADSKVAFDRLNELYRLFDRNQNYYTSNFTIYYSHPLGPVMSIGRDGTGGKLLKLSVLFLSTNLIS